MRILSIDTSCDESCAAIIDTDTGRLLADIVHSHTSIMLKWGGIVPEIASREHLKALPLVVAEACSQAVLKLSDIDWFTVTHRPGLIGALLVGVSYVKALAFALNKPFTVLNHIEAHLFSPLLGELEADPPPPFPWIALVVSGGHTELFHVKKALDFEWLGGTQDDAAGEAFDKVGKILGFPYPAGPQMDKLVRESASEKDLTAYDLPRAHTEKFSFSFSGLKTAVLLEARKHVEMTHRERLQLTASAQEAIVDPLVDKVRLASKTFHVPHMVITGGVACNSRLRAKIPEAYFPAFKHCTDNAAMVAMLSNVYKREGRLLPSPLTSTAYASLDTP